jgi:hypothetical protein
VPGPKRFPQLVEQFLGGISAKRGHGRC